MEISWPSIVSLSAWASSGSCSISWNISSILLGVVILWFSDGSVGSLLSFRVYQAGDSRKWFKGTLSLKVPISGRRAALGVLPGGMLSLAGCRRICPYGNFWRKSSHVTIPHYWNPQQVERLLDALAALGHRRASVAALIMWRSGLRVGETVALEWRDIDRTAGSLLVRRGKGGRGRTVPLHPDLASLFANWPASYGPRDLVAGVDPEDGSAAPAGWYRACRP